MKEYIPTVGMKLRTLKNQHPYWFKDEIVTVLDVKSIFGSSISVNTKLFC